jgi:hypothetical protein
MRRPSTNGAGTALAAITALFSSSQVQPFSEKVEKSDTRIIEFDGEPGRPELKNKSRFFQSRVCDVTLGKITALFPREQSDLGVM